MRHRKRFGDTKRSAEDSGDRVFRAFLLLAVTGCLWSTAVSPNVAAIQAWIVRLLTN